MSEFTPTPLARICANPITSLESRPPLSAEQVNKCTEESRGTACNMMKKHKDVHSSGM